MQRTPLNHFADVYIYISLHILDTIFHFNFNCYDYDFHSDLYD